MPIAPQPDDLRRREPDLSALDRFYDKAGFGLMLRRQAERIHHAMDTGK